MNTVFSLFRKFVVPRSLPVYAILVRFMFPALLLGLTFVSLTSGKIPPRPDKSNDEAVRPVNYSVSPDSLAGTGKVAKAIGNSKPSVLAIRPPDQATQARVLALLDTLPLSFEANRGQLDAPAEFFARTRDYNLYLEQSRVVLSFPPVDGESCETDEQRNTREQEELREQGPVNCTRRPILAQIGLDASGRSAPQKITGLNVLPGKSNYFIGSDPGKWHLGVPLYSKVSYENIYPGIDLVFHGTQRNLEFDFIVGPGADPGRIRLHFDKQAKVWIDKRGNLVLNTPTGDLRIHRPRVFQEISSQKGPKIIRGGYVLKGNGVVGFATDSYDSSRPLVIDPVLSYSTFVHGSVYDTAQDIAVDSSGYAYITGTTISSSSLNYPVTSGAFQTTPYKWTGDVIVTKLNPGASGSSSLVWSTYLGGSADDAGKGIAVNSAGNVFVVGQTYSANFPVSSGAFQSSLPSTNAAGFVSELNSSGSSLVYSTYLGGSVLDEARDIAVDSHNNAYVTGRTYSSDFPTNNAIQSSIGSSQDSDAFVTELNASGSGLVFSTFLGGSSSDQGNGIALDSSDNIYVAGSTRSSDFPILAAIQSNCNSCTNNSNSAFVTEIAAGGVGLRYSTYLGGSSENQGRAIATDSHGNAYVAGFTTSGDFPVTAGAYQTSLKGSAGAFVSKINPSGTALVYSSYLTGSNLDFADKITVSQGGNAYVTGQTYSTNFPTVSPTQATCNSCLGSQVYGTVFVTEMNVSGSAPVFSTFLGGNNYDEGIGIAVDPSGNAYVAGDTYSTNFTTTSNAYQSSSDAAGNLNAFMAKIGLTPSASISPTTLNFGSHATGTTSAAQTVTLADSGTAQLNISNIAVTGQYAETNNCGTVLGAGANCTISVTFTPTTSGTQAGTITITDNATGSPQTITLTGTGVASSISFSPTSLTFSNQNLNTTSTAQTVTLTNSSSTSLSINSLVASAQYAETNTCGTSVAAGGQCAISVTFTPTATGTQTGTITITDSATGSPQTISLTGTGVAPGISFSPTSLIFSSQNLNTTSAAQAITLTNSGTGSLTISSIVASAEYAETNTCGSSVAAGGKCTISVTFTPTAIGSQPGTITVTDNAAGSPQTIALSGTGAGSGPGVSFSPTSLTFSSQILNTTSAAQAITLTNSGTASLSINNIVASAEYAETNTCGTSVAAGGKCTISVTFTPTAIGTQTGTITVTDNASGSPQVVTLTGTGTNATGSTTVTLSPASLSFGIQQINTTSATKSVTLKNTGSAALNISSIVPSGDFSETNTCGSSLAVGSQCIITVKFNPTAAGTRTGAITLTDNAAGSPQTVNLTGTAADIILSPTALSFGTLAVGSTSAPQDITLTNAGTVALTITKISASGQFAQTNTCGSSVLGGTSCTISVTFTPTTKGVHSNKVTITDNATGSLKTVTLTGTGQ